MRPSTPAFLIVFAALAGCQPSTSAPENRVEDPVQPAPPVTAQTVEPSAKVGSQVASLAGAWRVAGIDGRSLDEPVGFSMSGDDEQLWWEPRCARVSRAYRIEGRRISFASNQSPGDVCDIGLPPRLDEVVRALDSAASVSRTPNNGVLISGPEHSVLLFSQ